MTVLPLATSFMFPILFFASVILLAGQVGHLVARSRLQRGEENKNFLCYNDVPKKFRHEYMSLPLISEHRYQMGPHLPKNHIYFIETSCNVHISPRQSCIIESAAKLHPKWQINVVICAPKKRQKTSRMLKYRNVKFWRVDVKNILQHTPLQELLEQDYKSSDFPFTHITDIIRFAILGAWDGVYLDLDMLLVRPLDRLAKNWAVRLDNYHVAIGALALSASPVGRNISIEVLKEIESSFDPHSLTYNSEALTRVLQRRCGTDNVRKMNVKSCKGFHVYDQKLFYALPLDEAYKYFMEGPSGTVINNFSFGYHLWNHETYKYQIDNGSPLSELAEHYCPHTYSLNKKEFGYLPGGHSYQGHLSSISNHIEVVPPKIKQTSQETTQHEQHNVTSTDASSVNNDYLYVSS